MKTMFVILMTMLLVCFGFSQSWAGAETEKTAVSAAETWLSIIDGGNYSGSWNKASAYFRGAITERSWAVSLEGVRKPLGKLISRKIVNAQETNTLPGAPDGKYVVMSFKTAFAQKKSAVETVTFMLDTDGKWRAAGYFIK
jgi:hypothetical protein